MKYYATQRVRIGGTQYNPGDEVPIPTDRHILPLLRRGRIMAVPEGVGGGGSGGGGSGYSTTVGDGEALSHDVTHNLGSTDVMVQAYDLTTTPHEMVGVGVEVLNANTVRITTATPVPVDGLRVVVGTAGSTT